MQSLKTTLVLQQGCKTPWKLHKCCYVSPLAGYQPEKTIEW